MNFEKINFAVKFLDPDKIISDLKIESGMQVAHFGCGAGFFTFSVAKKIGENGLVYAVDIQASKIEAIKSQAKLMGFNNIDAFRANLEEKETKIKKESLDWVFIVNMLYQNEKKHQILAEAQRILKLGGKILLIDWEDKDGSFGPDMKMRISKDELSVIIEKNNLSIWDKINVGNFNFGWILKK